MSERKKANSSLKAAHGWTQKSRNSASHASYKHFLKSRLGSVQPQFLDSKEIESTVIKLRKADGRSDKRGQPLKRKRESTMCIQGANQSPTSILNAEASSSKFDYGGGSSMSKTFVSDLLKRSSVFTFHQDKAMQRQYNLY